MIPLRTHTVLGHLFSLDILANLDVILRCEAVEIATIGGKLGKGEFQELFKYQIRFSVASVVSDICAVKETPLFELISTYFRHFYLFPHLQFV